jgi:hypothetical protein
MRRLPLIVAMSGCLIASCASRTSPVSTSGSTPAASSHAGPGLTAPIPRAAVPEGTLPPVPPGGLPRGTATDDPTGVYAAQVVLDAFAQDVDAAAGGQRTERPGYCKRGPRPKVRRPDPLVARNPTGGGQ